MLAFPLAALAQQTEYELQDNPAAGGAAGGGAGGASGAGWQKTDAPPAGSDEALIAQARRLLAEDQPRQAYGILDNWIEEHERTSHPLLAQAFRLRGDALTASGDEYNALYDYERVIKEFPASTEYVIANERELDIAVRYINGLDRKWLGMRIVPASDIGEELLVRVQERMPGSRLAERAGIELGDYYYRTRQLDLAVEAYDVFLLNYPQSSYKVKAMQRRVYATIAQYKGPKYDGSVLVDAAALITRFASLYPAQARSAGLDETLMTRLDESAAENLLQTARWYIRRDDDPSARYVLQRLVKQHPRTAAAEVGMQLLRDRGWPLGVPSLSPAASDAPATDAARDTVSGPTGAEALPAGAAAMPGDAEPQPGTADQPPVPVPSSPEEPDAAPPTPPTQAPEPIPDQPGN